MLCCEHACIPQSLSIDRTPGTISAQSMSCLIASSLCLLFNRESASDHYNRSDNVPHPMSTLRYHFCQVMQSSSACCCAQCPVMCKRCMREAWTVKAHKKSPSGNLVNKLILASRRMDYFRIASLPFFLQPVQTVFLGGRNSFLPAVFQSCLHDIKLLRNQPFCNTLSNQYPCRLERWQTPFIEGRDSATACKVSDS